MTNPRLTSRKLSLLLLGILAVLLGLLATIYLTLNYRDTRSKAAELSCPETQKSLAGTTSQLYKDITKPVVSILSPKGGASLKGVVSISVLAVDNCKVASVEVFYRKSDANSPTSLGQAVAKVNNYLINWDTPKVADGPYFLSATAVDSSGNVGMSIPIRVTVGNIIVVPPVDKIPPRVFILRPVAGVAVSGEVLVSAVVYDNNPLTKAKVEFYVDGNLKGTVAEPSESCYVGDPISGLPDSSQIVPAPTSCVIFNYSWDTTKETDGLHTILVKAYDAADNPGQAQSTINVRNTLGVDTQKPEVSVTAPEDGKTISGKFTLQAEAKDNVGVVSVAYYYTFIPPPCGDACASLDSTSQGQGQGQGLLPNGPVLIGLAKENPYSVVWDTARLQAGRYTVFARAYDAAGNMGQSKDVHVVIEEVTIEDKTPPTLTILSPGWFVFGGGTVQVKGVAADNDRIAAVFLYIDNSLVQTFTSTEDEKTVDWSYDWDTNNSSIGFHVVKAVAVDATENKTDRIRTVLLFKFPKFSFPWVKE